MSICILNVTIVFKVLPITIVCTVLMHHPCPCMNLVPYLVNGEYMFLNVTIVKQVLLLTLVSTV